MSTPKQAFSSDELGASDRISAKSKELRRFHPTAVSGVAVIVQGGNPTPQQVYVDQNGTVQFVNLDAIDYRLRLWTRSEENHPDVGVLLTARGGVTVIVDLEIAGLGECYYELIPFKISALGSAEATVRNLASAESVTSESRRDLVEAALDKTSTKPPEHSGGEVKSGKMGTKGPGGGIITVP
jgi:hypothetical protein